MGVIVIDTIPVTHGGVEIFGVPEPHATRLTRTVADRLALACAVVEAVEALDPASRIVTTAVWAPRLLEAGVPPAHLALLWGDRPLDARAQRWEQQGITILTGTMPRCVLEWLWVPEASAMVWEEDAGDSALRWENAPIESRTPSLASAPRLSVPARGLSLATYSSGGGVGKTTTAVYLATMASRHRVDTGLVELDENRSGMLTYWEKTTRNGGLDSVKPGDWSDAQRLAATLGTMVVPVAPRLSALAIEGTSEGLQYHSDQAAADLHNLYTWAQHRWGLTIYDLPATIRDPGVYHTLQSVDRILFVIEPTAIMYESSLRYLNIIQSLGAVGQDIIEKTGLVVNKVPKSRQARLEPRVLADSLGLPLWGHIAEQTQRYMAGINHHRITITPEWEKLWSTLALPMGDNAPPPHETPRRRSFFRRKEG